MKIGEIVFVIAQVECLVHLYALLLVADAGKEVEPYESRIPDFQKEMQFTIKLRVLNVLVSKPVLFQGKAKNLFHRHRAKKTCVI